MAIKHMVLSAPVSPGERKRFLEELKTREPEVFKHFTQAHLKPEEFYTFKGTRIKDVLAAFARLGWAKGSKKNESVWVLNRNGLWPVEVYASSYGTSAYIVIHLLGDGADEDFSVESQKLAKALFGSPSSLHWSAGSRRGQKSYYTILERAQKLGFKSETQDDTSIPDGSWMGSRTLYRRADGWNLVCQQSVGSVPGEYNFEVQLTYDARRGL
jgi:hypothetical protein